MKTGFDVLENLQNLIPYQNNVLLNLHFRFGLNIIAIENKGAVMEFIKPDYVFRKDDILILTGSKEGLRKLFEQL